ncbi:MAG: hypothetical protein CVV03_07320 [Firmicutes bacterium HGW-Firmicutes-8]|nr:MAG: hypothetical protein CVV03_07320 [Firmicutes bacterium HGW-Firmicutes-8]
MLKKDFFFYKRLFQESKGSVTLEATLVFPIIIFIIFSLVFLSMFIYQKLVLLDAAIYTAKQRAATWDNSSKYLEDGFQAEFDNDGLYWRVFNDFGGSSLVNSKIKNTKNFLVSKLEDGVFNLKSAKVNIRYTNTLVKRTVSVDVIENIIIPLNWLANILGSTITVGAKAEVAEPVEYIRNIDLAERYSGTLLDQLKNYLEGFQTENGEGRSRQVVASIGSDSNGLKVYHYANCPYVGRMKDSNRVTFDSPDQAIAGGYHLCVYCAKNAIAP